MKNILIGVLAISTLVLGYMQIESCDQSKSFVPEKNSKIQQLYIDLSNAPDEFPEGSGISIVDSALAKKIINANIPNLPPSPIPGSPQYRDPEYTSSAFFTFIHLTTLLKQHFDTSGLTEAKLAQLGFRIYLGKYDSTKTEIMTYLNNDATLYDRPTVLLQLMDRTNEDFKERIDNPNEFVMVNLGQLCPPKCPTGVPRNHDIFWVPIVN